MNRCCVLAGCFWLVPLAGAAAADDRLPGDGKPLLQLQSDGPTAQVTALAFGVRGEKDERTVTLYAAGYDKVVRTWVRDAGGRFVPGKRIYRLPIGPGTQGAINALALSPDGRWLAAAGSGLVREAAGFFDTGFVEPRSGRLSDAMLQDEGTITLFDTDGQKVHLLRGHRGPVLALAFAPAHRGKRPLLVSAAREWSARGQRHHCILRLWDADRARLLATSPELPDPGDGRPGLGIWHSGDEARELRVALACHGQPLRVWDADAEASAATVGETLYFNEATAFISGGVGAEEGTLFTTGTPRRWRAGLYAWKVSGAAPLQADMDRDVLLPEPSLSYALTLLPARPGGRLDRAALVQCLRTDNDPSHAEYRLLLLSVGPGAAYGRRRAYARLWKGGARPALAASPEGDVIAVAGGSAHEIQLYAPDDLSQDRPAPLQTLRSPGVAFGAVAFVRKGELRGLLLNERPGADDPWQGGVVFDVKRRALLEDRDGWRLDVPDLKTDGWGVYDPPAGRKDRHLGFVVGQGGQRVGEVWLQEGQAFTAFALLPVGPRKLPLLAIAFVEKGVPYLGLWNVRSGEQVRQLTGHLNPIRSLSFDAAGRRLVSAADDQMVCVWNLDDLEETLGRHGRLRGMAVRQQGASLRLAEIQRGQLNEFNRTALESAAEGDRVDGLVVEGKLKVIPTPHAFYEALWKLEPAAPWRSQEGERAVVRIAGRDVALRVDQGIDDRNPLFSLFITRAPQRQWVGWSPQGPYDTGDLVGGERYIGWHTNIGDADTPTTFAEAAKYHKEFYRDGILHFLLERGNLPAARKALEAQSAAPPSTDVSIAGLDPAALRDPSNPPLVQQLPLTLQARVTGIDPGRVASVEWQLFHKGAGGWEPLGAPRPFAGTTDLLQVDLSKKEDWRRGVLEARVAVKLVQDPPAVFTRSVWFRYLPPRPSVTFSEKWLQETFGATHVPERYDVKRKQLVLQASAAPGAGAVAAQVQVRHNGRPIRDESGAEVSVNETLDLREGRNDIEIVAVNTGASDSPELRRHETQTRRLTIYYIPNAPPPRITLLSITPAGGETLPLRPGEPLVIPSPRVRVCGEINAESDLTSATCTLGEEEPRTLSGFKEMRSRRSFRIDEEVVLPKAGRVRLLFRAGTDDQKAEEQTLSFDYHPELPHFRLTSPRIVAAESSAEREIIGRLEPAREPYPYKVEKVLVNGTPVGLSLQPDSGRLKVRTALQPGRNRLQVFLSNGYRSRVEEVEVYRQRPPRIVSFKPLGDSRPEAVDLQAVVETAADLPLTQASYRRHAVPDQAGEGEWIHLPAGDWKKTERAGSATWTLRIKDARLRAGTNGFTLRVANEDGLAAPATVTAESQGQRPDAPEVTLEGLPRGPVAVPHCDVTLRVRSSSSLHDLRLFRNGQEVSHRGLEKPAAREGRDVVIYRLEGVPLQSGMNAFTAEVSNDGGWASAPSKNVSYVEQTVDFHLEGYRVRDQEGPLLPWTTESPDSRVEMHGWLKWPASAGSSGNQPLRVRVWVNDFEQRDVPLQEGHDGVRRFRLPLCLTRSHNRVCLRFPEVVKLRQDDRPECVIRCRNPESRQRLHLLIVAPGEKNLPALTERVLTLFGAEQRDGNRFRTPAFVGGGRFYGPIPYYITANEIIYWLPFIRSTIINSPSDFSDVVLVYFQGQIRSEGGKHYLLTWAEDDRAPLKERALEMERLRRNLGDVLGAKLLLLDVQGEKEALPRLSDASLLIADLCYLWQSGANESSRRRLLDDLETTLAQTSQWGAARRKVTAAGSRSAHLRVLSANPEGYDDIPLKK